MVFFAGDRSFASVLAVVAKIGLLFCLGFGVAQGNETLEFKIKAAYLYNFTKFITWPQTSIPTFNICVVGDDPFQDLLDSLESKTVQDKPIRVFRFASAKQAKDCQIVYLDKTESSLAPRAVGSLTVSSQSLFAESGGMIGFALEDDKIKLHINLKAMKQGGLSISAKLIEVATLVEETEHD